MFDVLFFVGFTTLFLPVNTLNMLKFDENGHLEPYEIIEISLPEFETVFASNMNIQEH